MYFSPKEMVNAEPDNYEIAINDKVSLHAWRFKSKQPTAKAVVVQFHGNGENMTSHYVSTVWLINQGYDLFTFDYRGYGKSDGDPSQEGVYLDGLAALSKAWQLHQEQVTAGKSKTQFIVYGQSLGGAVAIRALADFKERENVTLAIVDSSFASYRGVAHKKLTQSWATWLLSPLAYVLVSDEYAPKNILSKNHTKLLVIHDLKDPIVPVECGQEFYELASGPKDFWSFDLGRHIGSFDPDMPANRNRLVKYLSAINSANSEHQ